MAPLSTSAEYQPAAIPDGLGGAFVAFKVPSATQIHVAELDATGTPLPGWAPVGIGGVDLYSSTTGLALAGLGRVWASMDNTYSNSYLARKVVASGLTSPDSTLYAFRPYLSTSLLGLQGGRVLIVGTTRGTTPAGIRLAAIEVDGSLTEVPDVLLPGNWPVFFPHDAPPTIPDGSGGAWVLGQVTDITPGTDADLVAARVASDGSAVLSPGYRVVCSRVRSQSDGALAPDGSNGVFVAWTDYRNLTSYADVYGTRLLADGSVAPGWTAQGSAIASFAGDQIRPSVVPDGSGAAWVAWEDTRSGESDINFTRLGASGAPAPGYPVGGRALCGAAGAQLFVHLAADGSGGFYAVWLDARDGELDLYGQHIHSTGVVMPGWATDGLPICTDGTQQGAPGVLVVSPGNALATWTDSRTGYSKVYAAALPADGPIAGVLPPSDVALELSPAQNPARGAIELIVSAAPAGPVRVSLHDVAGRQLGDRVLEGPVRGIRVRFDAGALGPGLYFASASRAGTATIARVSLVR